MKKNYCSKKLSELDYSIIIPAAGSGRRMKSYGPISLVQIKPNVTLVDYQLKAIRKKLRPKEIIIVVGYHANKIMNYLPNDIIKVENERYEHTNVVRSIGMALRACTTNNVLIIYGDLAFNDATLEIDHLERSAVITDNSNITSADEVGCVIHEDKIENIFYNIEPRWAQVVYIREPVLSVFKKICWDANKAKYFGYEVLNELLTRNIVIQNYTPPNIKTIDIDTSKDLQVAKSILGKSLSSGLSSI